MRMLEEYLMPYHQIGNGVHDLGALLSFQHRELDVMALVRDCR